MPHFDSNVVQWMFWILVGVGGLVLLVLGLLLGRALGRMHIARSLAAREKELFTAQKGFRQLYETDIAKLREQTAAQQAELEALRAKVDDYRKKAAGYGGLFGSNSRRADAMYALLLENEALEEALTAKNQKLAEERQDQLRESLRANGYRRVLMSHILADDRVKRYVNDILADDRQLPESNGRALPEGETK